MSGGGGSQTRSVGSGPSRGSGRESPRLRTPPRVGHGRRPGGPSMSTVQQTPAARRVERALPRHVEVSFVIPCLNEAESIEACVRAAWKSLGEADLAGEVIVVDNGSEDGSAELAEGGGAPR